MVPETLVTITLDPNAAAMSPARSSARAEASVPSYAQNDRLHLFLLRTDVR